MTNPIVPPTELGDNRISANQTANQPNFNSQSPNNINVGDAEKNSEGYQKLLDKFAELAAITDPIQQQYQLIQSARSLKLPLGRFDKMFQSYCSQQKGGQ